MSRVLVPKGFKKGDNNLWKILLLSIVLIVIVFAVKSWMGEGERVPEGEHGREFEAKQLQQKALMTARDGNIKQTVDLLQQIIDEFPETRTASIAERQLENFENQLEE